MSGLEYDHFKELCQEHGLKATSQRFLILKTLISDPCHPTADQLFLAVSAKLPGIGRDTVYRTLNILADRNMLKKLIMPGGATHFDGDTGAHHHFLCGVCGRISDFKWPDFDNLAWPKSLAALGRPRAASVLITGRCRDCALRNPLAV